MKQFHDAGILFEVFSAAARRDGISWCRYACEASKVNDARLVEKGNTGIEGHHELLADLKEKVGSWSIGRVAAQTAAGQIFDQNHKAWKVEPKTRDDYVQTMGRRVVNMCRIVFQGQHRSINGKKAPWVMALPWHAVAPAADGVEPAPLTDGASSAASSRRKRVWSSKSCQLGPAGAVVLVPPEADCDWVYQYSAEHNACARKSASDAAKPVEYSHRIDMDTVAKMRDDSPVQAVWPDGVCRPVPGMALAARMRCSRLGTSGRARRSTRSTTLL